MSAVAVAHAGVVDTAHNLSATGPGTVRAGTTTEVCAFCHTPHRAATTRALWSRDLPPVTYTLYASSTLETTPGQPTGATRLCLSCHDGTTALGLVRTSSGRRRLPLGPVTGRANLSTDLSDDHPVSFEYTTALARTHGQLADPATLTSRVPLDATRQLQCTACHDPHDNPFRAFLRLDDKGGALCTSCHQVRNFPGSTHANSPATWNGQGRTRGRPPRSPASPRTPARTATGRTPPRARCASWPSRKSAKVCLVCHSGNVARANIEAEFAKASAHPIVASDGIHDPREDPRTMARHVTCVDCHNPHQVDGSTARPPVVTGRLRGMPGVNLGGQVIVEAAFEYEVCFRCHGLRDQSTSRRAVRQDNTRNVRLEIAPGNASFHPVAGPGETPTVSGLQGWPLGRQLDLLHRLPQYRWAARPPAWSPRLALRADPRAQLPSGRPLPESPDSYALCYKCHSRTALLANQSGPFPHEAHLIRAQASCGVCHDAHGSRRNQHLINFLLRDPSGKPVVAALPHHRASRVPDPRPGEGQDPAGASCECHGLNHAPFQYG